MDSIPDQTAVIAVRNGSPSAPVTVNLSATTRSPKPDLSPATQLRRITPSRVQDLFDCTIWEFDNWKETGITRPIGGTSRRAKVNHVAFITAIRGGTEFKLSYYEAGQAAQIVKSLPMSMLPAAVSDLIQAGFGSKADFARFTQEQTAAEEAQLHLSAKAFKAMDEPLALTEPKTCS